MQHPSPHDIVVERADEGLYVAHCVLLPGYVGRGSTPSEAMARAREVIAAYLENHSRQKSTCSVAKCEVEPMYHFASIEARRVVTEKHLCDPHGERFFADFRNSQFVGSGAYRNMFGGVCVDFEMLTYHMSRGDDPVCVYVHEVGGTRRLCILTDGWAWWALMGQLKQLPAPCPRTHMAWYATIVELGGEPQAVFLDRHEGEEWWTSKLRIVKDGRLKDVDVRASDAYILAAVSGVPIFVDEMALERFADRGQSVGGG